MTNVDLLETDAKVTVRMSKVVKGKLANFNVEALVRNLARPSTLKDAAPNAEEKEGQEGRASQSSARRRRCARLGQALKQRPENRGGDTAPNSDRPQAVASPREVR